VASESGNPCLVPDFSTFKPMSGAEDMQWRKNNLQNPVQGKLDIHAKE
jgi:hypothetical protein